MLRLRSVFASSGGRYKRVSTIWSRGCQRRRLSEEVSQKPTNGSSASPSRQGLDGKSLQPAEEDTNLWLGTHVWRLVCAFGIVYVFTEYGLELTLCQGPSMLPTIRPSGEIVVVDRFTPRWHGLQGGTVGEERAKLARKNQERHEQQQDVDKSEVTWHQEMVPVNRMSADGAWDRFRSRLTTGVSVGDVVVLQHPDRLGTVCKRVQGLPGDIVTKPTRRSRKEQQRLLKVRSGQVVPDGYIWVEGDNPWNSSDSRTYGAVPASLIVGRVLFRIWPLRGHALMERGAQPQWENPADPTQLAFSSSIVIPAGYEHQKIVRTEKQ